MTGNITIISNKSKAVKKASEIVFAKHEGKSELIDNKLFFFLLKVAYNDLRNKAVHNVSISDIMDYLGYRDTSRILDALNRLTQIVINIEYIDTDNERHYVKAKYLSYDMTKSENGILKFAFDPIILEFLFEPKIYSLLQEDLIPKFTSKYGEKLYEIMSMYRYRHNKIWNVDLNEFRELMGIEPGKISRFDNFKRLVVESAVKELNNIADFDVEVDYLTSGKGGKISALKFEALPKSTDILIQQREVTTNKGRKKFRDKDTYDLLDGKTDNERKGKYILLSTTLDEAFSLCGSDPEPYILEWQTELRGRYLRDPDLAFIRWLKVKLDKENNQDENNPLNDLEESTLSSLIMDWSE